MSVSSFMIPDSDYSLNCKSTEMSLDEHLTLSCPLPWKLEEYCSFADFFPTVHSQATWKAASHIRSASWRLELEQCLLRDTVWCIHSQETDALATPHNPEQWAEANSIIKRSFYSLEFERSGTDLVAGRTLQSDFLVLLSLNKAQPELKMSTELGLAQKVIVSVR